MQKIYFTLFTVVFLVSFNKADAQCSYLIPSNVNLITTDSSINNSFLVNQQFLICPGNTLTVYGNSTGFNKFYIESGATVLFSDSVGATPYGMYSFYVKSGATLHYNASSPVSFLVLDTLVWENGATLIDTGFIFNYDSLCSSVIFDYSQIGGSPCGISSFKNLGVENLFSLSPNPFANELNLKFQNSSFENAEIIIYDLVGKELEHFYLSGNNSSEFKMKNNWSGMAVLERRTKNLESRFEKIIRR